MAASLETLVLIPSVLLINHGVESSLVEKTKNEVQQLFNLPLEEKKKYGKVAGDPQGFGQLFVVSEDQKLDWADLFYIRTLPPHVRSPHLFPKLPEAFRDTLDAYSLELHKLAMKILSLVAKNLGIKDEEMTMLFEEGMQSIRMNYYPPCPQPELVMGLSPHSDPGGLTILLQVNETKGLEIRKDGAWIPIVPIPNAFIVNVGDSLELINHGVNSSLVEKAKCEAQAFFNLPLEVKQNKYGQVAGEREGYGQQFVVSEEQKLDWADMFYIQTLPLEVRSPQLFPNLPEAFRNTIEAYSLEVHKLAMKILSLVAKILGIKAEEMSMLFEEGMQSIRMNYYPPCPQPELVLGLSPHSDAGGLTILLQANETQGLEIKKDGIWIPIVPIHNAFIVNIGGSLEIFTNGIYSSIEHRGVVNREKERISIATFHSPKLNGELGPASNLITPQTPAKFKRVSVMDYFRQFLGRKLDGKSHVDAYKIG